MKTILIFLCNCLIEILIRRELHNISTKIIEYLESNTTPNYNPNLDFGNVLKSIVTKDDHSSITMKFPQNGTPILLHHSIKGFALGLYNDSSQPREKYLSFSQEDCWHDLNYDNLPATIDFVVNALQSIETAIDIGHSMGTTVSCIYSVLRGRPTNEMSALFGYVPVADVLDELDVVTKILRVYSITYHIPHEHPTTILCDIFEEFILNSDLGILPVYVTQSKQSPTLKSLFYLVQIIPSCEFLSIDYGPHYMNMYKNDESPAYNLSQIALLLHLFNEKEDRLATRRTISSLSNNDLQVLCVYNQLNTTKSVGRLDYHRILYNYYYPDFFEKFNLQRVDYYSFPISLNLYQY